MPKIQSNSQRVSMMPQDQRDEYEERAAHIEFDAGMSRDDAEAAALEQVTG